MKGIKLLIVIFLFGCAASSISQNRIMLVGDSITRGLGSTDELGFRDALYDSLLSVSYPFSFVGGSGTEPFLGHFKGGIHVSDLYDGPGGTGDFNNDGHMDLFVGKSLQS